MESEQVLHGVGIQKKTRLNTILTVINNIISIRVHFIGTVPLWKETNSACSGRKTERKTDTCVLSDAAAEVNVSCLIRTQSTARPLLSTHQTPFKKCLILALRAVNTQPGSPFLKPKGLQRTSSALLSVCWHFHSRTGGCHYFYMCEKHLETKARHKQKLKIHSFEIKVKRKEQQISTLEELESVIGQNSAKRSFYLVKISR